jgi:hypothetical protein
MNVWCPLAKLYCINGKVCPDATNTVSKRKCAFWNETYCLRVENLKKNVEGTGYYNIKNPEK